MTKLMIAVTADNSAPNKAFLGKYSDSTTLEGAVQVHAHAFGAMEKYCHAFDDMAVYHMDVMPLLDKASERLSLGARYVQGGNVVTGSLYGEPCLVSLYGLCKEVYAQHGQAGLSLMKTVDPRFARYCA
ncbi:hypothetical protein ACTXK7_06910 [Vreelandella alkaliphila]|uniref:hypothetical protein n=1 Tax=Halomonadaceae TaxID=28256 RepID=UPI003CEEE5E1